MLDHGTNGALLVGERLDGALLYRGAVVLDAAAAFLLELAHSPLARPTSPFLDLPQDPDAMWLEPRLTVEVEYDESETGLLGAPEILTIGLDVDEE